MKNPKEIEMLGKVVEVKTDRPMHYQHPDYPDLIYPINYGYIEGIMGGDGEEQDAYILGVSEPVSEFKGVVIAIIDRMDDVETKWVVAPPDMNISDEDILEAVEFQEKYFHSNLISLNSIKEEQKKDD